MSKLNILQPEIRGLIKLAIEHHHLLTKPLLEELVSKVKLQVSFSLPKADLQEVLRELYQEVFDEALVIIKVACE